MKNKTSFFAFFLLVSILGAELRAQELFITNFETYETTPFIFRFGNKGKLGESSYMPRWKYTHQVVDNMQTNGNSSAKVLKYTSMEARNYGLKVLFDTPIDINAVKEIQFRIYQPENVIGKAVHASYSTAPATHQQLCLKLLSKFNTTNDFRQDDGILLYSQAMDFTTEGEWLLCTFTFNKADYASQLGKFTGGVLGVAILPTYSSDVTLTEENQYICYLDDIAINPVVTGMNTVSSDSFFLNYADGELSLFGMEVGTGSISVYTVDGKLISRLSNLTFLSGTQSFDLALSQGIYIVQVEVGATFYQQKITRK